MLHIAARTAPRPEQALSMVKSINLQLATVLGHLLRNCRAAAASYTRLRSTILC